MVASRACNLVRGPCAAPSKQPVAAEPTNDQSILRVVEIMAKSFNAPEHHVALALRDESDNLVTQANIAEKVASRETLK